MLRIYNPVFYICGLLCLMMAVLMLIPTVYAGLHHDPEFRPFLLSTEITVSLGLLLVVFLRPIDFSLSSRQLYLLTTSGWVLLSVIGAVPLFLCNLDLGITDAVFESVSGITTTGSTVISGLQDKPRSVLLWRSLLQWIGGLGVIGMAVAILPFLRVGGMRLFKTESSDWSDKSMPRIQSLARSLLAIYFSMTVLCATCYWVAGMTIFDAINHAMTTVSTGGYATDDSSMGRFNSAILWIATIFMLIGGMPFTYFLRILVYRNRNSFNDEQVKGFLLIVIGIVLLLTIDLVMSGEMPVFTALTQAAFNIASVITTTGYASADYTLWGQFSIALFFMVTFIGGCSGSTSGGMKIFRFQLSFYFLTEQFRKLMHPRGIYAIQFNGKTVQSDIIASAIAFSFLFFLTLAATTLILAAIGVDFLTAFTGAATALTNVGPGLGEIIGPAGNFAPLPDSAKWILAVAMLLGRLELLTIFVLFTAVYWRS